MPEHLHALLHLLPGNSGHLGRIVNGLMIGCTHHYWDTLDIQWREMRKQIDGTLKRFVDENKADAMTTKTQEKELRAQWQDKDHTRSYRGPALMVRGYNDVEAVGKEEIEIKRQYIRNNPRKRLITRSKPDRFKVVRNGRSKNWTLARVLAAIAADPWIGRNPEKCRMLQDNVIRRLKKSLSPYYPSSLSSTLSPHYPSSLSSTLSPHYPSTSSPAIHRNEEGVKGTHITSRQVPEVTLYLDYVGNQALLAAERKVSLICHRADAALFEKQKAAVMKAAREGAVVVSAFVSPKERDIMKQLMMEQLPFVELMDNGFSDRYKPGGKAFYSVAENRHVQMTCWEYQYQPEQRNENGEQLPTISREMCLVMNELARTISGVEDDWWK